MDKWLEILQNKSAHIVNTKNFVSYIYDQLPNMDAPRLKTVDSSFCCSAYGNSHFQMLFLHQGHYLLLTNSKVTMQLAI